MKTSSQTEFTPRGATGRHIATRTAAVLLVACILTIAVVNRPSAQAQNASPQPIARLDAMMAGAGVATTNHQEGPSIFVTEIPAGYRDWRLISVAHEAGNLNSFGAILGNDVAIKAYREGKLPYPDGTIIAALHWGFVPSEENNKIFGRSQSFVPGPPKNIQFMVKDSKKFAATGGWGFGHFNDGKPADDTFMQSCFPCHEQIKERDLVFTRYAP